MTPHPERRTANHARHHTTHDTTQRATKRATKRATDHTSRPATRGASGGTPRFATALILALTLLLALPGLALAQGGDGSTPHDHSMGDHSMGDHGMMGMNADAAGTTVTLGDATLRVEPLIVVSPDGLRASLVLAFDAAAPSDLGATLTAPDGTVTPVAVDAGDDPTAPSLAWASGATLPTGLWTLELRAGDAYTVVPIEVLHATGEDGVEGLLVMAPAPSMTTMGGTTAYLTVYRDGEDVHADPTLQRHMAGMQHSTDTEVVELQHVHAAAPGGGEAMPNVAAVSFAMVGTWSVDVTLQTSPPQVLHFDAEVRTP